jgi:hypothetical protein
MRPYLYERIDMPSESVVVGTIVGVTVGVVVAHVSNRVIRCFTEAQHELELEEATKKGYDVGWREASNSPVNIRRRYREMFETGETEGQAFKA